VGVNWKKIGKSIPLVPLIYYGWLNLYYKLFRVISPVGYSKHRYCKILKRKCNLDNPQTYSEKMVWLMHFWKHPLKAQCGDKFSMRDYVEKQVCIHTFYVNHS